MEALLKTERIHAEVAAQLYQIRIESGLSQRELAKKVGTSASVICRLENADYEGHSLAMQRVVEEMEKNKPKPSHLINISNDIIAQKGVV